MKPCPRFPRRPTRRLYVFLDQFVGLGPVGGNVYSVEKYGAQIAELGLEILRGVSPASLPIRELSAQVDLFDARQLKRWNLDDARLPPNSVVRYQEPSAWSQYRWYIIGVFAVLLIAGSADQRTATRSRAAAARRGGGAAAAR